jgi:hypothetical protein
MSCYNTRIRGNLLFLENITLSISICTCDVRSAVTHMSVISSSTSSLCVEDKKKIIKTRIDRNPSHARPDKRNVNSIRPLLISTKMRIFFRSWSNSDPPAAL